MLRADRVGVTVGGKTILDDVSIEIAPSEIVVILGANGAGKSTLLKALSGQIVPSSGTVSIDEVPIGRIPAPRLARRRAVLSQESPLTADFTAIEVVLLGRTPYFSAAPSGEDRRIAAETSEVTDVTHLRSRLYPTLSGGEKQRVQLARVLAQLHDQTAETRFLMLDEPTSSLDLSHQHAVLRAARGFAREGGGVVAILHDLNLAAQFADRLVLMKSGRVVASGAPRSVLTTEHIRATFGVESVVLEHPAGNAPLVVPIVEESHQPVPGGSADPGRAAGASSLAGRHLDPVPG